MKRVAFVVALGVAGILLLHAAHYFFLYDDFALVGESRRTDLVGLLTQPVFGFYRPIVFVFVKLQSVVFGWERPQGYAFVSILLHVANSAIWFRLLRGAGWSERASVIAAILFFTSPWAGETFFWVSCQFDLLATLSMLTALAVFAKFKGARGRLKQACFLVVAAALSLAAQLSKESAVILPVLSVALTLSRRRLQRGDAVEFTATALAVLLGLAIRSRFLPMLGGAYGGYFEVMRNADHLNNVVGYLSAFARTPFDLASPPVRVWTSLQFGSALFLTVFALREKRRALVLLLAFIACILPVLWLAPGLRQTDGSRALYSPSLLVVAVLGLAFERDNERATYPALVVYVLTCIVSLWYQSAVWRSATDLSRSVVAQVSQH